MILAVGEHGNLGVRSELAHLLFAHLQQLGQPTHASVAGQIVGQLAFEGVKCTV
jgi:hypothetical protein